MLSARSISGTFDGALFSLHTVPLHGPHSEAPPGVVRSARNVRLKVVGVPIDQFSKGATGPLSWIKSGPSSAFAPAHAPPGGRRGRAPLTLAATQAWWT